MQMPTPGCPIAFIKSQSPMISRSTLGDILHSPHSSTNHRPTSTTVEQRSSLLCRRCQRPIHYAHVFSMLAIPATHGMHIIRFSHCFVASLQQDVGRWNPSLAKSSPVLSQRQRGVRPPTASWTRSPEPQSIVGCALIVLCAWTWRRVKCATNIPKVGHSRCGTGPYSANAVLLPTKRDGTSRAFRPLVGGKSTFKRW